MSKYHDVSAKTLLSWQQIDAFHFSDSIFWTKPDFQYEFSELTPLDHFLSAIWDIERIQYFLLDYYTELCIRYS